MDGSSERDPADRGSSPSDDRAVYSTERSVPGQSGGDVSAGRNDESPLRAVGVAVGLGVAGILILAVATLVVGLFGTAAGLAIGTLFVASVAIGQYLGFIGLGLAYFRTRGFGLRRTRSYLGIRLPSLGEVGVIVAGYLAIIAILAGVLAVALRFLPEPAENEGAAVFAGNPELIPAGIVVMFLVVGPSEEFLFRGVVQNRLRERLSAVPAVAIAGSVFAVLHVVALAGSPSAVAVTVTALLVPGLVLGAVYEYTGNLVVPWMIHSIHNSMLLTAILLGGSGEGAALVWTLLGAA